MSFQSFSLRGWILMTLFLGAIGTLSAQEQKVNFVLIVADDLGFGDLSINGSTQISTPNIDAIAKGGLNCSQGYVSSAVCSPSRAGLLTGINQVSFGYDNNLGGVQPGFDPQFHGLPVGVKTLPEHLKELGYVSGIIGKWHLGYEEQFHPLKRGFDEFWGYTGGGHDYFKSTKAKRGYLAALECNYKEVQPITYITDNKGDECVDFIERHKDEPFFLYASFNAPHAPLQATEEDLELYKHIKDERRRTYAAMVHRLDVNVGKITEKLRESGLEDNTVVVFISDNGGPVFTNASNNAPFRGRKGILLEGGIRVPFFIKYPAALKQGAVYDENISSLDLTPTFIKLAGGDTQDKGFTGKDLLPYLRGDVSGAVHDDMFWRFTISAVVREGDWKLIRLPDRLPQLYNTAEDVSELNDLSLEYPEITRRLLKKLGDWDVSQPHPLFLEGAKWRRNQLNSYDMEYELTQPAVEQ